MILTEEEAKTKWCPESRMLVDATGYGAGNRFTGQQHPHFVAQTRCIGSACMAWRWGGVAKQSGEIARSANAVEAAKGDPRRVKEFEGCKPAGYCGNSGRVL